MYQQDLALNNQPDYLYKPQPINQPKELLQKLDKIILTSCETAIIHEKFFLSSNEISL